MKPPEIEWLLISEAVARLQVGIYGSLKQPEAVKEAKKHYPRASIGFGPQKEHAAKLIDSAVLKGELAVFVLTDLAGGEVGESSILVPPDVLQQMIRVRSGLPDRATLSMRGLARCFVSVELLKSLSQSPLYLRCDQFTDWYKQIRERRNWPSQRSSKKSHMGRPSKRTEELRNRIIGMVNDGQWLAQRNSIADLHRLLRSKGETPSRQTVTRLIKQLHRETGDRRYRPS